MAISKRFCERCRKEIPAERLEALPDTVVCIECSRAIGSEYELKGSATNIGKAGSLKKNYGGLSIRKRRKRIEPIDPSQG